MVGSWALVTVNGEGLPHPFSDTIAVPGGEPVILSGILLADTLELKAAGVSRRRTWTDTGEGPASSGVDLAWFGASSSLADSVSITEIFPAGSVVMHGVLSDGHLMLRRASDIRPGNYEYVKVES